MNSEERKKKMLLALPLLVWPFLALLFYAGGGGKVAGQDKAVHNELNARLPDPNLDLDNPDKFSLYSRADQDSQHVADQRKDDPFFQVQDTMSGTGQNDLLHRDPYSKITTEDEQARRVQEKVLALERQLHQPPTSTPGPISNSESTNDAELARLQAMVGAIGQASGTDPEMNQLNGMLEKVLDIQHPDRVKEKLKAQSVREQGVVLPVQNGQRKGFTDLFPQPPSGKKDSPLLKKNSALDATSFLSLPREEIVTANNAITAVIDKNQLIVDGADIKLRLTQPVCVGGYLIPAGTSVAGKCALSGERLLVTISSMGYQAAVFPVSLFAYSLDGMEGIYIPGAISRDAAKQGADDAIQTLQMATLDPSITAQATSAGIETVKSLLKRKAKLIQVLVKADHPILLVSKNNH